MTRSDLLVNSGIWGKHVVGKLSPWLQLDSPHAHIRRRSEEGPLSARDAADAVDELDDRVEAVDEALSSSGGEEDSDEDRKPLTRGDMGRTRGGGSYMPWRLLDPSQAEFKAP